MNSENLKIIYQEVTELLNNQQASIDLLYNKLNWILVSDLVFLGMTYTKNPNPIALLLATLSAVISVIQLRPEIFKSTVKIKNQLEQSEKADFLRELIEKKREVFNLNGDTVKQISRRFEYAAYLLAAGLVVQSLHSLYNVIYG